jgi:spermidine synthase
MYELLISTTSSYLLGDSVKQFSLTIGIYMAAMGVGSYLSQFVRERLLSWFVYTEIFLGIIGGISVPLLYYFFNYLSLQEFQAMMLSITFIIGALTGLEVPLLIRFLKKYFPLKSNIAYVLSLDYIGALIATLVFPFLLLPFLGTFKTSLLFGIVNMIMGGIVYLFFIKKLDLPRDKMAEMLLILSIVLLSYLLIVSSTLLGKWEDKIFSHKVIYAKESQYQNLVVTKNKEDIRLYINNIIQFSSIDEYRYHEVLAHIPLCYARAKSRVLILGGGEGLLAREVLKHPNVSEITIVDLDREVFELATHNKEIAALNGHALTNPKVKLVTNDAMQYLIQNQALYNVIIADLPDPSNESLSRLYSTSFYKLVKQNLTSDGIFVTQATSVFHTNKAFWCIHETIKDAGFQDVMPYHTYIPSFGDWGFIIGANFNLSAVDWEICVDAKYVTTPQWSIMRHFETDIQKPEDIEVNRMDDARLLRYFLEDWNKWSKELGTN